MLYKPSQSKEETNTINEELVCRSFLNFHNLFSLMPINKIYQFFSGQEEGEKMCPFFIIILREEIYGKLRRVALSYLYNNVT
jgi:hypothetical protein